LEYSGERKTALLPNELTSLDTIRALFVHSYQGLLTMPMLEPQRQTILLKNRKTGAFDEINDVNRIEDRAVLRIRQSTGIPMPGSKKPVTSPATNRSEKKSKPEVGRKLKEPSKTRIGYNSLPRHKATRDRPTKETTAGNGHGGGSIPQRGFSYMTPKGLKPPVATKSGPQKQESQKTSIKDTKPIQEAPEKIQRPKTLLPTSSFSPRSRKAPQDLDPDSPRLIKPTPGHDRRITLNNGRSKQPKAIPIPEVPSIEPRSPRPNPDTVKKETKKTNEGEVPVSKLRSNVKRSFAFGLKRLVRPSKPTTKPDEGASQLSPLHARVALIPKTTLVNSLLTTADVTPAEVSSTSSEEDKPSKGVLKRANTDPSGSSSSFASDSSVPSSRLHRPKKVSFRSDVTVYDEGGISTLCNGLERTCREISTNQQSAHKPSPLSLPPPYTNRQSLSPDATEAPNRPPPPPAVYKTPGRRQDQLIEEGNENPPYYECCVSSIEPTITEVTQMTENELEKIPSEIPPPAGSKEVQSLKIESNPNKSVEVDKENKKEAGLSYKEKLLKVQETAELLKRQCDELKRQQYSNMNEFSEEIKQKVCSIAKHIAATTSVEQRPLRVRRCHLDYERHMYGKRAAQTENQLSEIEAAVEELRSEVVVHKCRVHSREVESLVLQLSKAGRIIASMKGDFPAFANELKSVAASETEVICAEKCFVNNEPQRLDEQLKRCKQLTETLLCLKRLAKIQEDKSRDTLAHMSRPSTPGPYHHPQQVLDDLTIFHNRLMNDIKRIPVDHVKRMASIQEAELSWNRRRIFIQQYHSKKFEKALEVAEKALRSTDHIKMNEKRQQAALINIYNFRHLETPESNLTASESSSLDSLPPPPPPIDLSNHQHLALESRSSPLLLTPNEEHPKWEQGMLGSFPDPRSGPLRDMGYTGSLPRRMGWANRSFSSQGHILPPQQRPVNQRACHGRETPLHMMERSQSANSFQQKFQQQYQQPIYHQINQLHHQQNSNLSCDSRLQQLYEQHANFNQLENSRRLQEQYMKLQCLQKQQRIVSKKSGLPSPSKSHLTAKSSDV